MAFYLLYLDPALARQNSRNSLRHDSRVISRFISECSIRRYEETKRASVKAADAIICISETTKQDLVELNEISDERICVVYPGYSDCFYQLDKKKDGWSRIHRRPFILYVGGRSAYKSFGTLLKAYSRWQSRQDVDLLVVGGNWTESEKSEIDASGLKDKVHLLQNVDDMQLCRLYNDALGVVYPSLYEGFGIPLLEAMACGCPVVASRIPSTVEVAGEVPFYFEPGQADDLAAALDHILAESERSRRIARGLERAKDFSWEQTAKQTLEVYRQLSYEKRSWAGKQSISWRSQRAVSDSIEDEDPD